MSTKANPSKVSDCYANAEPDEPMFVLLGRDRHAPQLVEMWAAQRASEGEDPAKVEEALKCAKAMRKYRYDRRGAPTCEYCSSEMADGCLGSSVEIVTGNGFVWYFWCGSEGLLIDPTERVQTIDEYFSTDEVSNEYCRDEALRVYYETKAMRARANEAVMEVEPEAEPVQPTIDEIVRLIRRDCPFWAPEVRVHKLLPYLQTYGDPLYDALMALPEDERKGCGVDEIVVKKREA